MKKIQTEKPANSGARKTPGRVGAALLGLILTTMTIGCGEWFNYDNGCSGINRPRSTNSNKDLSVSWTQLTEETARGRVRNPTAVAAPEVALVLDYRDSTVTLALGGSAITAGWHKDFNVPVARLGSTPVFPDVAEIRWRANGTARTRIYSETVRVVLSHWEGVTDSSAAGVIVNAGGRTADSVKVYTLTREGEEVIQMDPRYIYPGKTGFFRATPGDESGTPVAPEIVRITWIGGEWVPLAQ